MGRIVHKKVGDQVGADLERVEQAQKFCQLLHVEVEPGDCLFFHCNVLHRSDQNASDYRRWAFLVCYNRASNNPVYKHHHPQYTPLIKVILVIMYRIFDLSSHLTFHLYKLCNFIFSVIMFNSYSGVFKL